MVSFTRFKVLVREELKLLRSQGIRATLYHLWLCAHRVDFRPVSVEALGLQEEHSHCHTSSGGLALARVLRKLDVKPTDRIVDVGSGKGGALVTLSRFPFSKIAGVELSEPLHKIAETNMRKLGIRNVELHCYDAVSFPGYDDFNYIYMYNPFPGPTMASFMQSISESLRRRPRALVVIYCNPIFHEEVSDSGLFGTVTDFQKSDTLHTVRVYFHETDPDSSKAS